MFERDKKDKQNNLNRSPATLKIILRQSDEVAAENLKLQQEQFGNYPTKNLNYEKIDPPKVFP